MTLIYLIRSVGAMSIEEFENISPIDNKPLVIRHPTLPIFLLLNSVVGGNCVFAPHQYVGFYSVVAIPSADDVK